MPYELLAAYLKLPIFALVAARLGGLLMLQPVLGAMSIPMNVRVLLILGLAALVTPCVPVPPDLPDSPIAITIAFAQELLLGMLIGLVGVACFLGLQLGALLVAQETGLAFGQIADPTTDDQETVLGVFYIQLAAIVYLVIGGHRALIGGCLETFQSLPLLGPRPLSQADLDLLIRALSVGTELALRVAGPALIALTLVNLALGFVSRTMPQLNIIAVGFSLKSLIGFTILAAALPTATDGFISAIEKTYAWLHDLVNT